MFLQNYAGLRYETITIPIAAGSTQTKINFPDQPNLRDVLVYGVELCFTNYTFFGGDCGNYTTNLATNGYITLYFNGIEGIKNIPLTEIAPITASNLAGDFNLGGTNNGILGMVPKKIIWTKSYIQTAVGVEPENDTNFVLGVYYKLK